MTSRQLLASAMVLCLGVVSHASTPSALDEQVKPKPCVWDEHKPAYKKRTFKIGQRKFKVRLGNCVPDADAIAILTAYDHDQVIDGPAKQALVRHSSAEDIYTIFPAGSWRSLPEEGFANSQYALGLRSTPGTLSMHFVSVDNGVVTLWAHTSGEI